MKRNSEVCNRGVFSELKWVFTDHWKVKANQYLFLTALLSHGCDFDHIKPKVL